MKREVDWGQAVIALHDMARALAPFDPATAAHLRKVADAAAAQRKAARAARAA